MRKKKAQPLSMRRKVLASFIAFVIAMTAILGGVIAQYTDQDESNSQELIAGAVDIALSDDVTNVNFNTDIGPMAAGDTFARYVNLTNTGNLAVDNISVTQNNGGGILIEGTDAVFVSISACSTAYVNGVCNSIEHKNLISKIRPGNWNAPIFLDLPTLEPAQVFYFKFVTGLPENAPNTYQAASSWLKYTFNGVQRGAVDHKNDGSTVPVLDDTAVEATNLTYQYLEDGSVQLFWNKINKAQGYRVDRALSPTAEDFDSVFYGTGLTVIDKSIEPNSVYYYRVVTFGKTKGDKTSSDWVTVATWMDMNTQVKLSGFLSGDKSSLAWGPVKGAASYQLERADAPLTSGNRASRASDLSYSVIASGEKLTSFSDTSIELGKRYAYRLTVVGFHEEKVYSEPIYVAYPLAVPVPALAQTDLVNIAISWPVVPLADKYRILKDNQEVAVTAGLSYNETLGASKTHGYRVVAVSAEGVESTSQTISVSTDPRVPSSFTLTPASNSITTSWAATQGIQSYRLLVANNNLMTGASSTSVGNATSYTVANLKGNTRYFVKLMAKGVNFEVGTPVFEVITLPEAPELSAEDVQAEQVTIVADKKTTEGANYRLTFTAEGENFSAVLGGTKATVDNLTPNTTYAVVATVTGMRGQATSEALHFTTEPGGAKLKGSGRSESIELSWNNVTGASYKLERSSTEAFTNATTVYEGPALGFNDFTTARGASYYYRLTTTVNSNTYVSASLLLNSPLESIVATAVDLEDFVEVNWNAIPGVTSYEITRSVKDDETKTKLYSGKALTFKDVNVPVGETYVYEITGRASNGQTTVGSAEVLVSLKASTLTTASPSAQKITATWTPVKRAQGYSLFRADNDKMENEQIIYSGSSTSFEDISVTPEESYYYRVRANSSTGLGDSMSPMVQQAAGIASLRLTANALNATQAAVSWTTLAGLTDFKLEVAKNRAFTEDVRVIDASGTSLTVDALAPAKTHFYRVTGLMANGDRYLSQIVSLQQPLAAASNLAASASPQSATLTWDSVANAEQYYIERFINNVWTQVGSSSTPTFTLNNLSTSTSYSVRVRSISTTLASTSEPLSFSTKPANITLQLALVNNNAQLTWTSASTGSTYKVYRSLDASLANAEELSSGTITTFKDASTPPGKRVYYRVVANDSFGQTVQAEASIVAGLAKPAVTGVITYPNVTLTWPAITGADNYTVYSGSTVVYDGTSTSFTLPAPARGESIDYTVRATSTAGAVSVSDAYAVAVGPEAVALNATAAHAFAIDLSWNSAAGASSYLIERATDASFTNAVAVKTLAAPANTYRDTVDQKTTYYYRVTARGNNQATSQSSIVSATTPADQVLLTASLYDATTARLTWEPVSTASYYRVFQGTTVNSTSTQIAQGSFSTFDVTNIAPGKRTYFQIKAYKQDGSEAANPSTAVYVDTVMAGSPTITSTNELPATGTNRSVFLSWATVGGATNYTLRYKLASANTYTLLASTAGASAIATVPGGSSIDFQVTAQDPQGAQVVSTLNVITGINAVTAPVVGERAQASLLITWTGNPVASLTGYSIERSNAAAGEYIVVGEVAKNVTSFDDTSVAPGQTYYYRIVSKATVDTTPKTSTSSSTSGRSGLNPITNFNVTTAGPSTQTFTWDAIPGVTSLVLQNNGGNYFTIDPSVTSLTLTDLSPATTYNWRLRATSSNTLGSFSATVGANTPWGAPEIKLGATGSTTQVVTWPSTPNARYILQRSMTEDFAVPTTVATLTSGATYTYTGLTPATKYYFRMQTQNTLTSEYSNSSVKSAGTSFATAAAVVSSSSPNPVSAEAGASLTITHSVVTNADTYEVEISKDRTATLETKNSANNVVTFDNLQLYTPYYVRITSTNAGGSRGSSAWLGPYTTSALAPKVTENASPNLYEHSLAFNLENPNGSSMSYRAEVYDLNNAVTPVYSSLGTATANSSTPIVLFTPLVKGNTEYSIKVVWTGPNQASSPFSFTTPSPNLEFTNVTKVRRSGASGSQWDVKLDWTPVAGATAYQVARTFAAPSGPQNTAISGAIELASTATSYSFADGNNYSNTHYMVRAQTASGWGLWRATNVEPNGYEFTATPYCWAVAETSTTARVFCNNPSANPTPSMRLYRVASNNGFYAALYSYSNGTIMRQQFFDIPKQVTAYDAGLFTPAKGDHNYIISSNSGGTYSSFGFHYYQP